MIEPFRREPTAEEEAPQVWALALLFSVNPTDRALYGWGPAGCGASLLHKMAWREAQR